MRLVDASLSGVESLADTTRKSLRSDDFTLANGRTQGQLTARSSFDQMVSFLNADAGGRYLFGGRRIDAPPVAEAGTIMVGQGGKAGFQTVARERLQADLGSSAASPERDPAGTGRVTLTGAGTVPIDARRGRRPSVRAEDRPGLRRDSAASSPRSPPARPRPRPSARGRARRPPARR